MWLGEVPVHWDSWKVSHSFLAIGSGTTPNSDSSEWYNGTIPWVTTGELRENVIDDTLKKVTESALKNFSALRIHPAGSLAIAMYGATIGRLGIFGIDATTNQACCVLSGPTTITTRFMFYWFLGHKEYIIALYATGGGQPNINQDIIRGLRIPVPSIKDQDTITAFLDSETAKIDALVAEQEKLIELLKEKRQAVISHAVTKGLDPNVPMKDSGLEWLGEVPEHWDVISLKRLWNVIDCKHVTAEFVDEGIPLASIREVQSNFVNLDNAKQTTQLFYELMIDGGRDPRPGDLIFSRNATVGEVAQVADWHPTFAMGQDVCLLRKQDASIPTDFLQFVLKSKIVQDQLELLMIGSTFKRINVEEIRNLIVAMPPANEQVDISYWLQDKAAGMDSLIYESQHTIDLLKERRSSLISAAVTGKIDVRGLAEAMQ